MLGTSKSIWDFEPRSVPGCGLWLDAADSSAVTIATGVSGWRDKSGNAYNLTQSTTESQPSYASNLITFSNNTHLNVPQAAVNNLSTWSLFFVINPISSSNWIMSKQKNGANSYNILSMTYNTGSGGGGQTGSNGFLYWRSFNAGSQLVSTAALATSTLQICNLTYDGTNLFFYKNGVLEKTTSGSFAITNDTSATNYTLGLRFADGSTINPGVTNFRLGEMILYSSFPSTTERQQVEGYLSRKWGITLQNLLVPLTVSNCVLWLDADDSTKFTGGSTWLDKSGTNNHGINGTPGASTMPTVTSWTNGRKAARFVLASKNSMKTTNSIANFVSYFMVARIQAAVGYGMLIINNLDGQRQFVMNTTSFPVALFWAPGGTSINLGSFAQGQGFVFCGTVTSGSGVGHMNGVQVGSNTNPSTSGSSQNYFGSANGDGGYLTIDIAEIMIYTGVVSSTDRQSIENYLSAKWAIPLSRSGVSLHPFNSIRPFLRRFNPIDISGCQVWLDAADRSTITLSSGSNVSSWRDKTGNGNNGTAVNTPTYSSALNAIACSSGACFSLPNGAFPFSNTSYTYFHVFLPTSGGTNNNLFGGGVGGSTRSTTAVRLGTNGASNVVQTYWWSNGISDLVTSNTYTVNAINIAETWYTSGGTRTITLNFAGSNSDSPAGPGSRLQSNTSNFLGNASDSSFGGGSLNGNHYEFLVYDTALTTSERQEVEGYLAYKWGLVSSLSATHSYKKLPPSSSLPFLPTGISGCQLWLDGADQSSMIFSGSNITQWSDKSGIANHATISSGRIGATFSTASNCVYFQASNVGYQTSYPANPTNETMFIVANIDSPSSTNNNTLIGGQLGARSLGVGWAGNADPTRCAYLNNEVVWQTATPSGSYTAGTRALITGQVSTGTTQSIAMNGAAFTTATSGSAYNSSTFTYLGVDTTTTAYYYKGFVMEIIFYNSVLTTSQRQQVEGYLAEKWGLKSSLPSTHLYRSFPPSFVTPIVVTSSSSIVTSNLIVNLDPVSYTASSTSWPATVGNTWTFSSAPSIVSTTTSVALSFNGSQYVMDQTGFTTGPASTSSFTIEVWFYAASGLTNNIVSEMGQAGSPGTGWNVSMMYIVSSTIQVAFWVGGVYTLSLGSYSANTWTHACYTYSGTTVTGYKNGVSVATGTASKQNPGRGYYCLAGAGNPIYSSTACRIGGFRIYSSVLSAAQVTQNYNAYAPRFGLSTI